MSDQDTSAPNQNSPRPPLANLRETAKPTALQNFRNYFGFGYAGNTATAIAITNAVKKFAPKLVDKWAASYEKKYIARKEAELITPYGDKLDENAQNAIRDKIAKDAKEYGHKTVEGRLLASGGFMMLPFQSAAEVNDYSKNIKGIVEPYAAAHGHDALKAEIGQQMTHALQNKDKKAVELLENALVKPKFSPLGPEATKGLPKWISGRVIALGSAFTVQKFVDDALGKQKDTMDTAIARIITKITHGGKDKTKDPKGENDAFAQDEAKAAAIATPEGVDPKILSTVRMITTDAYMTTVAIAAQKLSVDAWDNKLPKARQQLSALRDKFTNQNARNL